MSGVCPIFVRHCSKILDLHTVYIQISINLHNTSSKLPFGAQDSHWFILMTVMIQKRPITDTETKWTNYLWNPANKAMVFSLWNSIYFRMLSQVVTFTWDIYKCSRDLLYQLYQPPLPNRTPGWVTKESTALGTGPNSFENLINNPVNNSFNSKGKRSIT